MKKLSEQHKNYLSEFVETGKIKVEQPKGISIECEYISYCRTSRTAVVKIDTSLGVCEIRFNTCSMYGDVNGLGICYLNGILTNTKELIGEYKYNANCNNLHNIVEKIWNV